MTSCEILDQWTVGCDVLRVMTMKSGVFPSPRLVPSQTSVRKLRMARGEHGRVYWRGKCNSSKEMCRASFHDPFFCGLYVLSRYQDTNISVVRGHASAEPSENTYREINITWNLNSGSITFHLYHHFLWASPQTHLMAILNLEFA